MTSRTMVALWAACSLLFLASCGGGGGGGSSSGPPAQPPMPTIASVQTADPGRTIGAAERTASSLPAFGSVTQSSNAGSVSGITTDAVSTTFDGRTMGVTVLREDGSSVRLTTAAHSLDSIAFNSGIPGHNRGRGDAMLHVARNSASAAITYISWDNSDPSDYLAGGYWMHFEGDILAGRVSGAEIGAFVDGPEFDGPASLPIRGTATYQGPTEGLYASEAGTDSAVPRGSLEIGGFAGIIDLTANFAANTISGCVGCTGDVETTGLFQDARTGEIYEFSDSSDVTLRLGPAPIASDGSFRNRAVRLSAPGYAFTTNSGSWGGEFSNTQDSAGDPRLVAGTYGGKAETAGGSGLVFVGAYYANKR